MEKICPNCNQRILEDAQICPSCSIQSLMKSNPLLQEEDELSIEGYEIGEKLGEGGFGQVFRADQLEPIFRQVAIKLLKKDKLEKTLKARFADEIQALSVMQHPGIAQIYTAGYTDEGVPYYVMEYVKGAELGHYVSTRKLTLEELIKLFIQICEALDHAHKRGVIHRDLKPSNILTFDGEGGSVAKVIDFGISRVISGPTSWGREVTEVMQLLGTPEYMSPEQWSGEDDIDIRTDIYSLGLILHEILTGKCLLDGVVDSQAGWKKNWDALSEFKLPSVEGAIVNLEQGNVKGGAAELQWILNTATAWDREERYASANVLRQDLELYLKGEALSVGPPDFSYRAAKFTKKHKKSIAALTVVLLTLLFATFISTRFAIAESNARAAEELAKIEEMKQRKSAEKANEDLKESYYNDAFNAYVRAVKNGDHTSAYLNLERCIQLRPNDDEFKETTQWLPSILAKTSSVYEGKTDGFPIKLDFHDGRLVLGSSLGHLYIFENIDGSSWAQVAHKKVIQYSGGIPVYKVSPDASMVAVAGAMGELKVYEIPSLKLIGSTRNPSKKQLRDICFSADSISLYLGSQDGVVAKWPVSKSDEFSWSVKYGKDIHRLVEADHSLFVGGRNGDVMRYSAGDGRVTGSIPGKGATVVQALYNGTDVVSIDVNGGVNVMGASEPLEKVRSFSLGSRILAASFLSNDRMYLGSSNGNLSVWDSNRGVPVSRSMLTKGRVNCLSTSDDGSRVLSGDLSGFVRLWNTRSSSKAIQEIDARSSVMGVALMKGWMAYGTKNRDLVIIKLEDQSDVWLKAKIESPHQQRDLNKRGGLRFSVFDREKMCWIIIDNRGDVHKFAKDALEHRKLGNLKLDKMFTASRIRSCSSFDSEVLEKALSYFAEELKGQAAVTSMSLSSKDAGVMVGCSDGKILMWKDGVGTLLYKLEEKVEAVHLLGDHEMGAVGDASGVVYIFKVGKMKCVISAGILTSVQIAEDGMSVAISRRQKDALIYDISGEKPKFSHALQYSDQVYIGQTVGKYSPCGKFYAVGNSGNDTVVIFDLNTGEPIGEPIEHVEDLWQFEYSACGKYIYTLERGAWIRGGSSIRVWSVDKRIEVLPKINLDGYASWFSVTEAGNLFTAGDWDEVVWIKLVEE